VNFTIEYLEPDRMCQSPWMLLCNPYSPQVVWPGHFVTDRTNPQNYFAKEPPPSKEVIDENVLKNIEVLPMETPSLIEDLSNTNKLSFSLSSFASQYFSRSEAKVEHLKATRATRYLLIQADLRLDELSADAAVQDWLEKKINRDKKKVWMITGILTLLDAERVTSKSKDFEIGVGGAVPVFAAAGVPAPLPGLDVSADVQLQHKHGYERAFAIPDEKVFEIQFTRVKLKSRKGESFRDGLHLGSKPRWEPQWALRSATYTENHGDNDDEGDYESEEEPEALEASLSDDSDDETSVDGKGSTDFSIWPQQTEAEAQTGVA
jgi:hypothetical protein